MAPRMRVTALRWATGAALLLVFLLASLLLMRHDFQHDFTQGHRRSLAPQTRRVLANLKTPLRLVAFYADLPQEQQLLRDLVDRFRDFALELRLDFVDLDRHPEQAEEYGVTVNRTVVVESGDLRLRTVAPGEAELLGAIVRATSGRPSRVYFVEGHGEASIEDESRAGIRDMAAVLARQNFDLRILHTKVTRRIPADADLVVLASPESEFTDEELAQLTNYLLDGGRLLAMVEPYGSASADTLLARFGIIAEPGFVADSSPEQQNLTASDNPRFALALGGRPGHSITNGFDLPVIFPVARGLHLEQPPPPGVQAHRLLETQPESWREMDAATLGAGRPRYDEGVDVPGPIGLAFAATVQLRDFQLDRHERATLTSLGLRLQGNVDFRDTTAVDTVHFGDEVLREAPPEQARLVVIGDVDFVNNANLRAQGNSQFFLACALWLADQENRIAIAPPPDLSDPIVLTQRQTFWLRVLSLAVLPLALLGVGVAVAWRRRQWV